MLYSKVRAMHEGTITIVCRNDLAEIEPLRRKMVQFCDLHDVSGRAVHAFNLALDRFDAEGRQPARLARYTANMRTLYDGLRALGLTPWLPADQQGPIIVNFHAPTHPGWNLQEFVDRLKDRGFLISNFYNTDLPTFRVGCIGAITPADMAQAVNAMGDSLKAMGIHTRQAA